MTMRRIRIAYHALAARAFSTGIAQWWPLVSIHVTVQKAETEHSARAVQPLALRIQMIGTATHAL